jgi:hypothetical protein
VGGGGGVTVGTRSLLFGVHQFLLHPVMVALGWRMLYGRFPRDPRVSHPAAGSGED